jgi:hypothetical protein
LTEKEAKVKEHTQITIALKSQKGSLSFFFPLLQEGFAVKTQAGCSIKDLLCEEFGVDANYLEDRIQTIFLDGKPVDNAETAIVKEGSTVALSAAMPGLVGSTFRRGGVLAAFRNGITYREKDEISGIEGAETVTVKLFNLLVGELGPVFLQKGILVKKQDAERALKDLLEMSLSSVEFFEKDGREISHEQFAALDWSEEPEDVLLSVML